MNAQLIAQLLIALGPLALDLIPELIEIWSKPELTVDEVRAFCQRGKKTYAQYIAEARALVAAKALAV